MSNFQDTLAHVRGKRQYVARAVNSLMHISNGNGSSLKDITWESFLALPSWCLLDKTKISELQLACGAVFLQMLVKASVDGAVLKQFREVVGESLFNFLFESIEQDETQDIHSIVLTADSGLLDTIQSVGASVLLGTLSDLDVIKVYMPVLGKPLLVLNEEQSHRSYGIACQALELGRPKAQPPVRQAAKLSEASSS